METTNNRRRVTVLAAVAVIVATPFVSGCASAPENPAPRPTVADRTVGDAKDAFAMNARLGRGINMGNMFEAPSEGAWGNPYRAEYFRLIADLGFSHVRIPVRWEPAMRSSTRPPYQIAPVFLNRVREVVDAALANGLLVIVNMHHHDALFADPHGQRQRFLAQWRQIADFFREYPEDLLFEVLNEPHGNLTPQMWNAFFSDALAEIRRSNPERFVLLGTAEWGGLSGVPHLVLPADGRLILSVHYYNPFNFTHQGASWVGGNADAWLGTEWHDTEAERASIENEFRATKEFSERHAIPIHVGEFGAYSTADMDSRVRWTRFLARWFEENGWSWAYWEFSAGFGIYDPARRVLREPLVDALLHDELPAPRAVSATTLYDADFSRGTDGWSLSTQDGATARLERRDAGLDVAIDRTGSETWHVQLVRPGVRVEKDGMYRVVFSATTAASRNATVYVGRAGAPWDSYSGYTVVTMAEGTATYDITFTMGAATDERARLVFDLGQATGLVSITGVRIERLEY